MAEWKSIARVTYESLRDHYAGMHARMIRQDKIFEKQFMDLIDVPYELRIFESSTGSNIVEGFRNQLRTDKPTVVFRATGRSKAHESHANLMQKWGYGQLRMERIASKDDPTLQNGFDLLLRGACCKKILVDVDKLPAKMPTKKGTKKWMDWEYKAMDLWPFVSRAIDPLSVYPDPSDRKPLGYIVEKQYRTAGELERAYPNWENKYKDKGPGREVEWLEYWDPERYVCEAEGQMLIEKENPYGFVPYIFEYSGMGKRHYDNDPRHLAIGVLTHVMGELEEEVRLKTSISVQTQMHIFPPILTVDDPQTVADQFTAGPGKVVKHQPNFPPEYMKYPEPNENLYQFLGTIDSNISHIYSPALAGGRSPGVDTGVQQAQQIGQSLKHIAPIVATMDSVGTQTLAMMAMMAKKMDIHQTVEGSMEDGGENFATRGNDFTHLNFDVTFEIVDPAENDRAMLAGMALRRNGDISQQTLWEKYAKHIIEDYEEERTRLLEEQVLAGLVESGALIQIAMSRAVQEQMGGEAEAAAGAAEGTGIQDRRTETTPVEAATRTTELEQLSGQAGLGSIPREVAQQGFAAATEGAAGIPPLQAG